MKPVTWVVPAIVIVLFGLIAGLTINMAIEINSATYEKVITVQAKFEKSGDYLVTDSNGNIYSANLTLYTIMTEGRTYLISWNGLNRLPHPMITSVTQSTSLETNACYLRGITNGS